MAQTPRGGLYGPPSKGDVEVCAICSETTVCIMLKPVMLPMLDQTTVTLSAQGSLRYTTLSGIVFISRKAKPS